ncbi:MAG TPA: HAMP domain-containing sensor histidine kinase [Herpetosiphonaceae bacterium]|nr:HAMP domain-containing sensor histidine kinase [Herpetosiphonaceae bacterium]
MDTESAFVVGSRQRRSPIPVPRDDLSLNTDIPTTQRNTNRVWLWAAAIAVISIGWAVLALSVERTLFAVINPRAQLGVEAASAFATLFGALVLFLFPTDKAGQRLRWLASGFVILGLGGLLFGYLLPLAGFAVAINTLSYASLTLWSVAAVLFVVGLLPRTPPPFTRPWILITLALLNAVGLAAVAGSDQLPPLVRIANLESAVAVGSTFLPGLTAWHWALSILPLALSIAAVVGAARQYRNKTLGGWLVVAMVLLAGAQLHSSFWPALYSPILTTASLLRLGFAAVVLAGATLELRAIAAERARLLATEQEQSRRLTQLSVLKAEFTAMVAHEIGNPLAAVRACADMLATRDLPPDVQAEALATIRAEAKVLTTLMADVQAAAAVERVDFAVQIRAVPLRRLTADATAYAGTLPGDHPFSLCGDTSRLVWADEDRIGQVLRNLLSNAAKYSPDGTPIELRTLVSRECARLEVVDHGPGIHPNELRRIFGKFGRGRDHAGQKIAGMGLGLYLSRRIIRAHGMELEVQSTLGEGTVFGFDLDLVE